MADFDRRHLLIRPVAGPRAGVYSEPGNADRRRNRVYLDRSGAQSDDRQARFPFRETRSVNCAVGFSLGRASARLLRFLLLVPVVLSLAADDARDIVRRSVNVGDENVRAARN